MAGNVRYISSDGYIVDPDKAEIKLTPDLPNENGLYNRNVNVRIDVSDVQSAENLSIVPYSEIAKIEYWLTCEKDGITVENDRKTLYSFDYKRENKENSNGGAITEIDWSTGEEVVTTQDGQVPIKSRLKSSWSGTVTVDAVKNNSCNVIVHVGVTDNAGNYNEAEQKLDIDVSVPTVSVSYDGTSNDGAVENYFTSRTATVVITERNHHFDAKQATESIRITADGVDGQKYTIGEWLYPRMQAILRRLLIKRSSTEFLPMTGNLSTELMLPQTTSSSFISVLRIMRVIIRISEQTD